MGGLNFNWAANDGSLAFTYYVPQGYCCGDSLNDDKTCMSNSPKEASYCQCSVQAVTPIDRMKVCLPLLFEFLVLHRITIGLLGSFTVSSVLRLVVSLRVS